METENKGAHLRKSYTSITNALLGLCLPSSVRRDSSASEGHIGFVVWRWRSHSKSNYGACPEFCEGEMRILCAISINDDDAARPSAVSKCMRLG